MSSYPNMSAGGAYQASWQGGSGFTDFSFHTNAYNWGNHNLCGRFMLAFSGGHSNSINETIYSYESIFLKAQILFKKKGGSYVPLLSFLTTTPNQENNTEFYNPIWSNGTTTEYDLETNSAIME